jgi:glycosyltransferase involved in cell wall biosynthesis
LKKYKNNVLFIGSFLSATRGSKGIAESLSERLKEDGIERKLVSTYENKILRLIDILFAVIFSNSKKIHIDVFSGSAFTIADIASKLAKFRKKEILFTLHGGKLTEFATTKMSKIHQVFNRADYIQTPSLFLQSFFQKEGFNIHYLPNSVSLEKFSYAAENRKAFSLLWVRAFIPIYNPHIAVEILNEVKKKYPESTLTMVGPDKGELASTKLLATQLKILNSITFTGAVANNELEKYYQSHSIFLNTTSYESFGVALIEAALCGIPIVSNNVGEIPFLWSHKENIMLVENNSVDEYKNSIYNLFEDPNLYSNLSTNARAKAEAFNWKNIKPMWLNLLVE